MMMIARMRVTGALLVTAGIVNADLIGNYGPRPTMPAQPHIEDGESSLPPPPPPPLLRPLFAPHGVQ